MTTWPLPDNHSRPRQPHASGQPGVTEPLCSDVAVGPRPARARRCRSPWPSGRQLGRSACCRSGRTAIVCELVDAAHLLRLGERHSRNHRPAGRRSRRLHMHPTGPGDSKLTGAKDELGNYPRCRANFSSSRLRKSHPVTPPCAGITAPGVCDPYIRLAPETRGRASSPKDDEEQRRPGLSDPRSAEARRLVGGLPTDLEQGRSPSKTAALAP